MPCLPILDLIGPTQHPGVILTKEKKNIALDHGHPEAALAVDFIKNPSKSFLFYPTMCTK